MSYRFIEQPIRALDGLRLVRIVSIAFATIIPPLAFAIGLNEAADNSYWTPKLRHYIEGVTAAHQGLGNVCVFKDATANDCWFNAKGGGKPIYLVGDSNAAHFSEAIADTAVSLGRPATLISGNNCPFLDVALSMGGINDMATTERCQALRTATLKWLREQPPGVVVLSTTDVYWWDSYVGIGLDPEHITNDPSAKIAIFRTQLSPTCTEQGIRFCLSSRFRVL